MISFAKQKLFGDSTIFKMAAAKNQLNTTNYTVRMNVLAYAIYIGNLFERFHWL